MHKIREYNGNKKFWGSMDETTDVEEQYVVNVIIGSLLLENSEKIFLLLTDVLNKVIQQSPKWLINLCLFYTIASWYKT